MSKVKMRKSTEGDSVRCYCCNQSKQNSVEMFDVMLGTTYFRLCDRCMSVLADKALVAKVEVNHKVKTSHDMSVIRKRGQAEFMKRRCAREANKE